MLRVIVNVRRPGERFGRDLEVPAEVDAEQLAEMIARALGWEGPIAERPIRHIIIVEPAGRVLQAQESLSDAGLWDGSYLLLQQEAGSTLHAPCLATITTQSGRVIRITKTKIRVGRNARGVINDIDLGPEMGSQTVHRRHLRLEYRNGQWYLQVESGATNPTSVHGQRVQPGQEVPLHDGDEIRVARVNVTFHVQHES